MNAKLLALLLLVMSGWILWGQRPQPQPRTLNALAFAPERVGPYQATAERWLTTIEVGARYRRAEAPAASLIQLDFHHNAQTPHNGLICYLAQGESLRWQRLETLATAGGPVQFMLGLTQSREQIRLVAASECRASACAEAAAVTPADITSPRAWLDYLRPKSPEGVVPMSIVLTAPYQHDLPAVERRLLAEFHAFVPHLDLTAARQLAARPFGE